MTEPLTLGSKASGRPAVVGVGTTRVDGVAKVTGTAAYAYEQPVPDPVYVHPIAATIAKGKVIVVDSTVAESLPGVLGVLTHANAPRLAGQDNGELLVLQSSEVRYRGQFIAAVMAESAEIARQAGDLVEVRYAQAAHDVAFGADRPDLRHPEQTQFPDDASDAAIEAALAAATVSLDQRYSTPTEHHNPMEPHATVAAWAGGVLTVHTSTQGTHYARQKLADLFGLERDQVRVTSPYVGGGFGAKIEVHPEAVLAVMAALRLHGRAAKVMLTRQQMFTNAGYRSPTANRVRLAADRDGTLTALAFDAVEQSSLTQEFFERSFGPARMMYSAGLRRTTHRVADLDVAVPTYMRAPGHCPGMFGLEVAMDELAVAAGVDPIELRVRNEPAVDPDSGLPFGSRHLVECLHQGARRFGWGDRDPAIGSRLRDGWLHGSGVASATLWDWRDADNSARIRYGADGVYTVQVGASDIGTGSWTALTQIAADALSVPLSCVRVELGDTTLPQGSFAGGSMGTRSWGAAVLSTAETFVKEFGQTPPPGAETVGQAPAEPDHQVSKHSFGAHFAEVRVCADTGEVRVSRLLSVFSCGRIINPRTTRSQFLGAMTMGLGMALHEHGVVDERLGMVVNHDLAGYHIPTCADVAGLEAHWIEDADPYAGPLGARGVGEIGIVGVAAAIANATFHATGLRVRDLPLTPDKFLG